MKKWLTIVCGIALLGLFLFWRMQISDSSANDLQRYEPVSIAQERLTLWIEATGEVRPRNRLQIRPPLGGRVEEMLVVEGQQVEQGEVLAWISSTERAVLLDAARAQGAERLQQWMDIYKPTALVAPLNGTVIARRAEPGQTLSANDVPIVLSDRLIVFGRVDETDIGLIRHDQIAKITLDAYPEVEISGYVAHIAYEARTIDNVIVYEVEIEIDHIPEVMRSGMTTTIDFLVKETEEVLTVPADAVYETAGTPHVLIKTAPDLAPVPRDVTIGQRAGGRIEIVSGLDGTEQIVRRVFLLPKMKDERGAPFLPRRR